MEAPWWWLYRRMALSKVRRAKGDSRTCQHRQDGTSDYEHCVDCAFNLGRSVGHAEAGAVWTHGEVFGRFGRLRRGIYWRMFKDWWKQLGRA